jgi:outer membrane protein OmpA-like peptidoglycan-associated protein
MPGWMIARGAVGVIAALSASGGTPDLGAQQQVQVVVTAVPNPIAAGGCAGIWAEVRNAQNQRLIELNGVPLHSRSYDFSLPSTAGVAWRDNDPASGYLCVQAGVPAVNIPLIATVRSTSYSGATIITIQSGAPQQAGAPAQVASTYPAGAGGTAGVTQPTHPQPAYPQPVISSVPSGGATQPGYAQPTSASGAPQPGYVQPTPQQSGYPSPQPGAANAYAPAYAPMQPPEPGPPQGAAPTGAAPSTAYAPQPNPGAATQSAPSAPASYPAQGAPVAPMVQAPGAPGPLATAASPGAAAAASSAAQPAPAAATEKGVGGFLKRFGTHIKQKAGDVTSQTAQNLAGSATQLVDTTLQTGSGLVSTTVAGAGNTARMTVGGAGKSLIPSALRGAETSDNLASAVAGGRAVLRAMRFTAGTAVLEPASQELAVRLAGELKKVLLARPGTYLLSAHVDPILTPAGVPIPSASQQLSERRAAAVKVVLVKNGVLPTQLIALGYGASQPLPETAADGTSSSARIEIARTQ